MIRLWNDRKLASEFAEGKVSEKEKFAYFLIYQVGILFIADLVPSEQYDPTLWDWISASILVFITAGGYFLCFRSNKDNKEFIARCICLGVPILVKTSALFLTPVFALLFSLSFVLREEKSEQIFSEPMAIGVSGALLIVNLWRLNADIKLIQKISSIPRPPTVGPTRAVPEKPAS